jgi:hypothetical protein
MDQPVKVCINCYFYTLMPCASGSTLPYCLLHEVWIVFPGKGCEDKMTKPEGV